MTLSPRLEHVYVQIIEDLEQNGSVVPGIVRDPYPFISQSDIVDLLFCSPGDTVVGHLFMWAEQFVTL